MCGTRSTFLNQLIKSVRGFQPTLKKFIEGFILSFQDAAMLANTFVADANRGHTLTLTGSVYLKEQEFEYELVVELLIW